jgi:hypothetical protein
VRTQVTWRGWLAAVLVCCAVLALGVHVRQLALARAAGRLPPVPSDEAAHRLRPIVPGTHSTSYSFLQTLPNGAPVAYDPCRPIHYVIRSAHLPSYGAAMIQQAVASVSAATGLLFVDDGLTAEPLSEHRASIQARYGDRWAPVLIAFSDGGESSDLSADVMGRGGSVALSPRGPASARYVTGEIRLDQADFDVRLANDAQGYQVDRAAIMHELGHVVGLGHVQDSSQLMDAYQLGGASWGSGDRQGLSLEGQGRCQSDT